MANVIIDGKFYPHGGGSPRKLNIFEKFWNWLKKVFSWKKKKKVEDSQEKPKETPEQFVKHFEIKVDDINKDVFSYNEKELGIDDLYITKKDQESSDVAQNRSRIYKTFVQDEDVRNLILGMDSINQVYKVSTPEYFMKLNESLLRPEVQRGLNKVIQRYITCFEFLDDREKSRWERMFSKIMLAYNVDKYSFIHPNPNVPGANPANRSGNFYGFYNKDNIILPQGNPNMMYQQPQPGPQMPPQPGVVPGNLNVVM